MRSILNSQLDQVATLAQASKVARLVNDPAKYLRAIAFRAGIYRWRRQPWAVLTRTFWGQAMHLLLPASTDIYLTGGKTHDSEIRLARFLIYHLKSGDTCIDIGAHYGYFSLLAAHLVEASGKVVAFEAAPATYRILAQNAATVPNLRAIHQAVSDTANPLTFYEFPNLYSEYNSTNIDQYTGADWFRTSPPKAVQVPSIVASDFLAQTSLAPAIIKIDVEGGEYQVIRGLHAWLLEHRTTVVMEYLVNSAPSPHQQAAALLYSLGYHPHAITDTGQLQPLSDIDDYLAAHAIQSDNIVFSKA